MVSRRCGGRVQSTGRSAEVSRRWGGRVQSTERSAEVSRRIAFQLVMPIGNQKIGIGTKKIPIPIRYLVFLSQFSWYFLGILSESCVRSS